MTDDPRVAAALHEWELRPAGEPVARAGAVDLPVRRRGVPGTAGAALLRLHPAGLAPDDPLALEHVVLRRWAGDGAVRLLAADPTRGTLLLERPEPGDDLTGGDLLQACEVLGAVLRRVAVPAAPQLPPLVDLLRGRAARLRAAVTAGSPLPRRMLEEAARQAGALAGDEQRLTVPLGLAFDTVLTAQRAPHLLLSGVALAGDPAAAAAIAAVTGRRAEAERAHRLRTHLRLRLEVLCETAGVDEARTRAHGVVALVSSLQDAVDAGTATAEGTTAAIATVKALQG